MTLPLIILAVAAVFAGLFNAGNVFGHPGLHIADGSVMPGPTGPNPSFTIAALADRFADQIIEPDRRAAEAAAS